MLVGLSTFIRSVIQSGGLAVSRSFVHSVGRLVGGLGSRTVVSRSVEWSFVVWSDSRSIDCSNGQSDDRSVRHSFGLSNVRSNSVDRVVRRSQSVDR